MFCLLVVTHVQPVEERTLTGSSNVDGKKSKLKK